MTLLCAISVGVGCVFLVFTIPHYMNCAMIQMHDRDDTIKMS